MIVVIQGDKFCVCCKRGIPSFHHKPLKTVIAFIFCILPSIHIEFVLVVIYLTVFFLADLVFLAGESLNDGVLWTTWMLLLRGFGFDEVDLMRV